MSITTKRWRQGDSHRPRDWKWWNKIAKHQNLWEPLTETTNEKEKNVTIAKQFCGSFIFQVLLCLWQKQQTCKKDAGVAEEFGPVWAFLVRMCFETFASWNAPEFLVSFLSWFCSALWSCFFFSKSLCTLESYLVLKWLNGFELKIDVAVWRKQSCVPGSQHLSTIF